MVSNKSHTGFVGEMVEFKLILRCTEKNVKKKKEKKAVWNSQGTSESI